MRRVIAWLLQLSIREFTGSLTIHVAGGKVTRVEQHRRLPLSPEDVPGFDEEFSGERVVRVEDGEVMGADDIETIRMEFGELPMPLNDRDLAEALKV